MESLALNVVGQDQSGERLSLFLEDWEFARVALSCHMALDMLCQEMSEACSWVAAAKRPFVTAKKAFLSPWTGCGSNRAGCGERNRNDKLKS